ncbi:hypothetical protein JCM11641_002382 [Rhodosporidiobolus odoratus]
MASNSFSASPHGPLHLAHPSTATSHTPSLASLFRPSSSSHESTSSSRPTKRTRAALVISSPTLISTSNRDLPTAPAYSRSSPPAFSASSSKRASTPPPPYFHSSFLAFDDDDESDHDDDLTAVAPLVEKTLLAKDVVEARMQSWEVERRVMQRGELNRTDLEVVGELRR